MSSSANAQNMDGHVGRPWLRWLILALLVFARSGIGLQFIAIAALMPIVRMELGLNYTQVAKRRARKAHRLRPLVRHGFPVIHFSSGVQAPTTNYRGRPQQNTLQTQLKFRALPPTNYAKRLARQI